MMPKGTSVLRIAVPIIESVLTEIIPTPRSLKISYSTDNKGCGYISAAFVFISDKQFYLPQELTLRSE